MSEDNKKTMVHRLMEAINEGEMDVVDELFVPELAKPTKRSFTAFRSAFPDWRREIVELVQPTQYDTILYSRLPRQGGEKMKVEVLYFKGCSTYTIAEQTLRKVLEEEGTEAEIELVAINSDEEARRFRFPGSPTLRLDGRDLFPAPEREDWRLGCRVYATPDGLKGSPTAEMIRAAFFSASG